MGDTKRSVCSRLCRRGGQHNDKVRVSRSAYVTVLLFEDSLYKFVIEPRKLEVAAGVADKFIIEQTDLQSNLTFKFSHTVSTRSLMSDRTSGALKAGNPTRLL